MSRPTRYTNTAMGPGIVHTSSSILTRVGQTLIHIFKKGFKNYIILIITNIEEYYGKQKSENVNINFIQNKAVHANYDILRNGFRAI